MNRVIRLSPMASGNSNGLGVPGEYDGEGEEEDADREDADREDDNEADKDHIDTLSVNEIVKNWEICKYCLTSLCSIIQNCTAECKLNHYRILFEELLLHTYHQGILKRVTFNLLIQT